MAKLTAIQAKNIIKGTLSHVVGFAPGNKDITNLDVSEEAVTAEIGTKKYKFDYSMVLSILNFREINMDGTDKTDAAIRPVDPSPIGLGDDELNDEETDSAAIEPEKGINGK